jgi:site-specific DNA recombinase
VKAGYVRVSTEEQSINGYSIYDQIEKIRKKAETDDIIFYTDEGYTGEILNRPQLSKLRADIEKGIITEVVCYDPDRLSRNLLVQLLLDDEFKKANVKLTFVNGDYQNNPEGKMFFSMRGAISEFEKSKIKERTGNGRYQKAKKGKIVKNHRLYGYDYDKEKSKYVINKQEAAVIKMIFDAYTTNRFEGINGLALHLSQSNIPTKNGAREWHRQVVRQILKNEAYIGNHYQNKYDTEGNYVRKQSGEKVQYKLRPREEWLLTKIPAIISQEQFDYTQKLLEQGRRRYTNYGTHDYLLSGLVRCHQCGGTMTGRKKKSHGKDYYVYECRKNTAGAKHRGCGREMSENKLNHFVWETLIDWFNNPEKISEFTEEETPVYVEVELKHLETEIEKMKKGRKRLFTLVSLSEDDDLDLEEIKEQIRELQLKEKELTNKYNQLTNEIKAEKEKEPSQLAFEKAVEAYLEKRTQDFTFDEKQALIRMAVKEIVIVNKDLVHIHLF